MFLLVAAAQPDVVEKRFLFSFEVRVDNDDLVPVLHEAVYEV